ncbi:TetR/AcrR family transcriptional regulator [Lacrimispora brassicae]
MRNVKEAEERKNEILDAADELFGQKGFDGTSTNDILEKVGIARGTLYYHFKSKEDIMDALIERYHVQLVNAAKEIASNKSLPVTQRLLQVIKALRINHKGGKEIIEQMHKPQNALMHQKTQKAILNGITPILAELIKEGMETGVFDTPYPYESMEMIMTYANGVFDGDMEMTDEEQTKRIQAFAFNMERLLGGKDGTLKDCVMQMFDSE